MIIRRRRTTAIAAAAFLTATSACVTPMMHPIRVPDGFVAEAALSPIIFTGRHGGCDNETGCTDSRTGEPDAGINIHLTGGYGTVLADTFGIMGGIYMPAQDTLKAAVGAGLYSFLAAWGWFTVQCPWAVLGVGPEFGVSGWALAVGGSVRPFGDDLSWSPELGVYGRVGRPWELHPKEFNGQVPGWDVGVRLQVEFLFLQYAYYRHTSGVMDFTIWETSVYTDTMHFITLGITLTPDTLEQD
ncbi:MAG: hypothetical protein HY905_16255 [Deltaproteobacteria bacterium]|nr:hypothetical protein [Deltaproteobacteria bacterium]